MDLGLKGKRAVLVGATSGIGRAAAEALAAEGCNVAVCARTQGNVDTTVAALKAMGVQSTGAAVDVSDKAAYKGWIDSAAAELGGIDIFACFTSAGGGPASEKSWRAGLELDILPTFNGIQAALPHLEKSDCGSIIIMATNVAIEPYFGPQAYSAVKAALLNYAAALTKQLGPKNIRVNSISPGPVFFEGGSWDQIKQARPELYEATVKKVPLGRLGNGPEFGRAIAFLASPAVPLMTGVNLVVDGGILGRAQH